MADITPVALTHVGATPVSANAAELGDAIVTPTGRAVVRVTNGSGSSMNVTVDVPTAKATRGADGTYPSMTLADQVVAVPAGASRMIGPFPPAFVDSNGKVQLTYSDHTSVTVEAYSIPA